MKKTLFIILFIFIYNTYASKIPVNWGCIAKSEFCNFGDNSTGESFANDFNNSSSINSNNIQSNNNASSSTSTDTSENNKNSAGLNDSSNSDKDVQDSKDTLNGNGENNNKETNNKESDIKDSYKDFYKLKSTYLENFTGVIEIDINRSTGIANGYALLGIMEINLEGASSQVCDYTFKGNVEGKLNFSTGEFKGKIKGNINVISGECPEGYKELDIKAIFDKEKIILKGNFTSINGTPYNFILKLYN